MTDPASLPAKCQILVAEFRDATSEHLTADQIEKLGDAVDALRLDLSQIRRELSARHASAVLAEIHEEKGIAA